MATKEDLAVIETGGKQYIVQIGDVISVEKLEAEPKKNVTFDKVLLLSEKGKVSVGTPTVECAVTAEVIAQEKDKKVRVFKFKKKTGYKKTQGHRQNYTTVRIKSFDKKAKAKAAAKTTAKSEKKVEATSKTEK